MDNKTRSTIHLCAEDGEYLPNPTVMKGAPDDMLTLICTAIHIYMQGAGKPWEDVAYKLIRDVLYEEKNGKPRNPRYDRILGAVVVVVFIFAVLGFMTFLTAVITRIVGPLP